jgi:hypothetical protein
VNRRAQKSTGEHRRAQESTGEHRREQESTEEHHLILDVAIIFSSLVKTIFVL